MRRSAEVGVSPVRPEPINALTKQQSQNPLITKSEALADLCCDLQGLPRFGFDAEFVAEEGYAVQTCLLQVVTEAGVQLIDPLAGLDLTPFWELVCDEQIETIVHAGLEDLAMCYHQFGCVPRNIFDVQIAAGLVGPEYPLSLQRLARSLLGVKIHKSQTLSNWHQRPLSHEQFQYAVEDVAHLLHLHAKLCEKLTHRNRLSWAKEEFEKFSDPKTYRQADKELFRKVRGIGSLSRRALAIAREVTVERERLAKELDRPPRVLLKDHLLVAIAKHGLDDRRELKSLRGMTLRSHALERIIGAVRRGAQTPVDQCPEPVAKEDDTAAESMLRKLVATVIADYSRRCDIAVQMLGTSKDIRSLVLTHTRGSTDVKPGLMQRGWRREAIGDLIDDVLAGRCSLRIVDDGNGPALSVDG